MRTCSINAIEAVVTFEWKDLKDHSHFSQAAPLIPKKLDHPVEPLKYDTKYEVKLGLLDKIFASRKARKISEAENLYDQDHAQWEASAKAVDSVNAKVTAEFNEAITKWNSDKATFLAAQKKRNDEIDALEAAYLNKQPDEVVDYCDLILSGSEHPDSFPEFMAAASSGRTLGMLLVEYSLPNRGRDTAPSQRG